MARCQREVRHDSQRDSALVAAGAKQLVLRNVRLHDLVHLEPGRVYDAPHIYT
jgi:hypothetical protein